MPPTITKSSDKRVSAALTAASMTWKLLRMTKQIEFSLVTTDFMGKPKHSLSHKVDLTDDELDHLDNGGKIIIVHACGYQPHIKI
jgi:hypothetical protein